MDLKPLKSFETPSYPSGSENMEKNEGFLNNFVPKRWLKPAIMTGAALLLSFCQPVLPANTISTASGVCFASETGGSQPFWNFASNLIAANDSTPQPEFGRTAGKPAMISTLTESEAQQIVSDEFRINKVKFERQNYNIGKKDTPMILDGYTPRQQLGYKIISSQDWSEIAIWSGDKNKCFSSSEEAAQFLEKKLLEKRIRCACIYIPDFVSKQKARDSLKSQVKEKSKTMR
ncbi:MAG: hypothetical protein LWY06_07085 [Firmicutes bacterium]|nr:hypothetical protein [Bacillota bacterium]